jgi:hypothetical protein
MLSGCMVMQSASYYRRQAERARRLGRAEPGQQMREQLAKIAKDFEDLAAEIERGAIEVAPAARQLDREG